MYYDKLTKPYIVGIETNRFSLRNIMEAIKNEVHKQNYVYCDYSSLFLNTMVTVCLFFQYNFMLIKNMKMKS